MSEEIKQDGIKQKELNELNLLIRNGFKFTIKGFRPRKWWQFWKKRKYEAKNCVIKEPTLAVLDLLSTYWIEFEDVQHGQYDFPTMKMYQKAYALSMGRVVAVAVLGEDCFDDRYNVKWRQIEEDARFFAHYVHPSELFRIAEALTAVCNIVDFLNSMRLMCVARSTRKSDVIES